MKFISNKLIGLTFLGLLIYLTVDFLQKKEEKFWQFNYDWNQIEILQNIGKITVDSVQANYLKITSDNKISSVKANTLELTEGENKHYFNFENAYLKNNTIKFTGGFWVLNHSIKSDNGITAKLVNLPLKQTGETKINLITDSQLLWRGGRSFRKWLKEENYDFYFVGAKVDLYGFPYNGEIVNTTKKTLRNNSKIPKADVYLISLGTHEPQQHLPQTIKNYKIILQNLKNKNDDAEIYIITAPPSTDLKRNDYNKKLNEELKNIASQKIHVIDFYALIENNYEDLLTQDKNHYQTEAYKKLVNHLNKQIHGTK